MGLLVLLFERIIQVLMLIGVIFLLAVAALRWPILVRHQRLHAFMLKLRTPYCLAGPDCRWFYNVLRIHWGLWGAERRLCVTRSGVFSYDALLNLQNLHSLGEADFSAGFTTFSVSCGILALFELCFGHGRKFERSRLVEVSLILDGAGNMEWKRPLLIGVGWALEPLLVWLLLGA